MKTTILFLIITTLATIDTNAQSPYGSLVKPQEYQSTVDYNLVYRAAAQKKQDNYDRNVRIIQDQISEIEALISELAYYDKSAASSFNTQLLQYVESLSSRTDYSQASRVNPILANLKRLERAVMRKISIEED